MDANFAVYYDEAAGKFSYYVSRLVGIEVEFETPNEQTNEAGELSPISSANRMDQSLAESAKAKLLKRDSDGEENKAEQEPAEKTTQGGQ